MCVCVCVYIYTYKCENGCLCSSPGMPFWRQIPCMTSDAQTATYKYVVLHDISI